MAVDNNIDPAAVKRSSAGPGASTTETRKSVAAVQYLFNWVAAALQRSARTFNELAGSRLSDLRIDYAAYILRSAGILVAAVAIFSPLIESGLLGIVGWLVDLFINLVVGIVLFMIAEIALTIRELSEALKSFTETAVSEQSLNDVESSEEGY